MSYYNPKINIRFYIVAKNIGSSNPIKRRLCYGFWYFLRYLVTYRQTASFYYIDDYQNRLMKIVLTFTWGNGSFSTLFSVAAVASSDPYKIFVFIKNYIKVVSDNMLYKNFQSKH